MDDNPEINLSAISSEFGAIPADHVSHALGSVTILGPKKESETRSAKASTDKQSVQPDREESEFMKPRYWGF